MDEEQILGSWNSTIREDSNGAPHWYDRMQLTFNYDGTGHLRAKTLLRRNTSFVWESSGKFYYLYNLAGQGSIAVAIVDGNKMGVIDSGILTMYMKE